eukprot:2707549-Lingulodinium_polyedra.AAC.1
MEKLDNGEVRKLSEPCCMALGFCLRWLRAWAGLRMLHASEPLTGAIAGELLQLAGTDDCKGLLAVDADLQTCLADLQTYWSENIQTAAVKSHGRQMQTPMKDFVDKFKAAAKLVGPVLKQQPKMAVGEVDRVLAMADVIECDEAAYKKLDTMLEMLHTVTGRQKIDGMRRLMNAWSAIQYLLKSLLTEAERKKWDELHESVSDIMINILQRSRALETWSASAKAAFADISKQDSCCELAYDFAQEVAASEAWLQSV